MFEGEREGKEGKDFAWKVEECGVIKDVSIYAISYSIPVSLIQLASDPGFPSPWYEG